MCGNVVWGKHKITSEEKTGRTERWGMEGERQRERESDCEKKDENMRGAFEM